MCRPTMHHPMPCPDQRKIYGLRFIHIEKLGRGIVHRHTVQLMQNISPGFPATCTWDANTSNFSQSLRLSWPLRKQLRLSRDSTKHDGRPKSKGPPLQLFVKKARSRSMTCMTAPLG